jgi:hypothetical protein
MIKKTILNILFALLFPVVLSAQEATLFKQHNMKPWGIPAGNYSGITNIGDGRYALVSDKQNEDGWTEVSIGFLPSGNIGKGLFTDNILSKKSLNKSWDCEGIAYVPEGRFFVAAESSQQILELSPNGEPTNRTLTVPACFSKNNIFPNYGFESLAYNKVKGIFWTTTEQGLRTDVSAPSSPENRTPTLLRLQSFDTNLKPLHQYVYKTDAPIMKKSGRLYAFGVSEMLVVNDTTLLVMERELNIPNNYNRAKCYIRIYSVNPERQQPITDTSKPLSELDASEFISKKLVCSFSTGFRLFGKKNLANYEGVCLGPISEDGSQTILLVCDSQNRAGKSFYHLKDYIRVIKFP